MSEDLMRNFTHLTIPAEIWLRRDISIHAKALWAELRSLHDKMRGGCYASDEYLMEFLGVKRSRLHEVFKELKKIGLMEVVSFNGRQAIRRAIVPEVEYVSGQQLSGKPDTSSPENRTPPVRKTGFSPYTYNKEENKDVSEHGFGRIVSFFFDKLKEINPKFRKPNLEKWAIEMQRLIEKDGRTEEEVRKVILYIVEQHKNPTRDFTWSNAVMSPEKLRKHFATIWLEMKKKTVPKQDKEKINDETIKLVKANCQWMQEIYQRCSQRLSLYPHIRITVSDNLTWLNNGRCEQNVGYAEPGFRDIVEKFFKTENLL